ncbi:hypothetical protein [Lactococcus garvieae]|uniref:Uncharacterized protein n=1 Tax=Lactococcus garvieae DCC43 TaxID=1231377 RepID=K2PX75_9LACT|nr:hypothetical protein [Lactococcus garvieae]EKF52026.1 hypothetical protein C426_0590 [Lactococcus garvieae DCC43]
MNKKESKPLVTGVFLDGSLEVSSEDVEDSKEVAEITLNSERWHSMQASIILENRNKKKVS